MRFLIIICILFFLNNCGYSPLYNNSNEFGNFTLNIKDLKGDDKINTLITKNLKRYEKSDNNNKLDININTQYYKEAISKNLSGKTSKYRLTVVSSFEVYFENNPKTFVISVDSEISANDNSFEQNRSESNTKENLSKIIVQKLITEVKLFK